MQQKSIKSMFEIMKVIKARKILKAPGKVTVNGTGNDDVYGDLLKSIEEQSGLEF